MEIALAIETTLLGGVGTNADRTHTTKLTANNAMANLIALGGLAEWLKAADCKSVPE